VAYKLIKSSFDLSCEAFEENPSKGKALVMLSVATSIDAFAVGLSITFMGIPIVLSVLAIGLVSAALGFIGLFAGNRLSCQFGKRMELVGGLVLLYIAVRVVVTHLDLFS
jgi:putative Mn2+ efflux pump MntP